jgi:transketolase
MRTAFINSLTEIADENTMLLIGDLGYSVVERFGEKFPKNLINCGVAEQNMTGISAGLALEGFKVFTYSIANFNTMRCLEQIRNDICYHNLDVTIVSVGAGFVYGSAGFSHHAIHDIGIMAGLPNMTLLLPGDPDEMIFCVDYALKNNGPKYLRIGNNKKKVSNRLNKIAKLNKLINNKAEYAVIGVAGMLDEGKNITTRLFEKGFLVDLFSMPICSPVKDSSMINKLSKYKCIFIIEDHLNYSGIRAILSFLLQNTQTKVYGFGLNPNDCYIDGNQAHLLNAYGLEYKIITDKIIDIVKRFNRGK